MCSMIYQKEKGGLAKNIDQVIATLLSGRVVLLGHSWRRCEWARTAMQWLTGRTFSRGRPFAHQLVASRTIKLNLRDIECFLHVVNNSSRVDLLNYLFLLFLIMCMCVLLYVSSAPCLNDKGLKPCNCEEGSDQMLTLEGVALLVLSLHSNKWWLTQHSCLSHLQSTVDFLDSSQLAFQVRLSIILKPLSCL